MPCDTITTNKVAVDKLDPGHAAAAIKALGLDGQVVYRNGQLEINGRLDAAQTTARVKQAYGAEVVLATAKKFGWQTKKVGAFKYEVIRR